MLLATLRHYVGSIEQLSELGFITDRIIEASQINPDIQFRLSLNWPKKIRIREEVIEGTKTLLGRLYDNDITTESYQGFGIGYAFFKSIFNYFPEANQNWQDNQKVVFVVDANQFDVSDKRVITSIRNIAERITLDERIVGMALRDYVKLASEADDDEIRRIEELYHIRVCPRFEIENPQAIDTKDIHPLYLKYGDVVPGVIGFNLLSREFPDMLSAIHTDLGRGDLTKYPADPYAVMLAGILTQNHGLKGFYSEVTPTTRITRGTRFDRSVLTQKSRSLRYTFVGKAYKAAVEDLEFEKELLIHFKEKNVLEAKRRILEGFS